MAEFPGPLVPARPASTVLVLRRAGSSFEVLMVRRAVGTEFMGNAYVFPGGAVDDGDRGPGARNAVCWSGDPEEAPWRAAALRELHEEAGIALTRPRDLEVEADAPDVYRAVQEAGGCLDADRLIWVSNWITPEGLPKRFDTRFYLAVVDRGEAAADGVEVFDDVWVEPAEAMRMGDAGEWDVPMPTRAQLEMLCASPSLDAVVEQARSVGRPAGVLPRIVVDHNGNYSVLIPGDPGYESGVGP